MFDAGDLGWRAPANIPGSRMAGHIVLTGRAKDTIVMSNGKNVEPQPLEDVIGSSSLIKHAAVVSWADWACSMQLVMAEECHTEA